MDGFDRWCEDNDYGLYKMTREEWVPEAIEEAEGGGRTASGLLADRLAELLDTWAADVVEGEPTSRELRMMLDEIGSRWRVDFHEIAEAWLSEL